MYEARGRTIIEFIIMLSVDRPGILAAISDVFAENGVNILNVSFNRMQRMIHVICDFTNATGSVSDVEGMLRKFSFVSDVLEKILDRDEYVLATLSIPTFNNSYIVAIDHDILEKTTEGGLPEALRMVGERDGELAMSMYGSFKPISLGMLQLRGLGRVQVRVSQGNVIVRVCRENLTKAYIDMVSKYLEGFLRQFKMRVTQQSVNNSCIEFKVE